MALLLNIDTATPYASVGISRDGQILDVVVNDSQKEHASFLQPAIANLAQRLHISLSDLDGIALTIGPGSYTGLRVGLSSAKGLAYALHKPLIAVNTLEVMAYAARRVWASNAAATPDATTPPAETAAPAAETPLSKTAAPAGPPLFCPMIDARRDEVFTAIYNANGSTLLEPRAMILHPEAFDAYLKTNSLIFSGDGSLKWKSSLSSNKARFLLIQHSVSDLAPLAETRFRATEFASLPYLEPMYLKEFHKGS